MCAIYAQVALIRQGFLLYASRLIVMSNSSGDQGHGPGCTEAELCRFEQQFSLVNGWCVTCEKYVPEERAEAHFRSSSHRWRSRICCRKFVLQNFQTRAQREPTLEEALEQQHSPFEAHMDLFIPVTFRHLSGEAIVTYDVPLGLQGMLDCQSRLANLLKVHPSLFRINWGDLSAPNRDAYISRQTEPIPWLGGCSLCLLESSVMSYCQNCRARLCDACTYYPTRVGRWSTCWGCSQELEGLNTIELARKRLLRPPPSGHLHASSWEPLHPYGLRGD